MNDRVDNSCVKIRSPFATKLKELRSKYGLSVFQLSIKLGHTPSKISHYEQDLRKPTRGSIDEIAQVMGLSSDERNDLLLAAGLLPETMPEDLVGRIQIAMHGTAWLSDDSKQQILDFVKDIEKKHGQRE